MSRAVLTISSKNYSSWSLRGWLLAHFAGLEFEEAVVPPDDPEVRAEMLLLVLKRQVIDSAARQAMLEVVEKIGSSYDQGRVLVAMVRADRR